ncbi:hypothetical protein Q4485_15325 [Granulosicoccaceae sp. 1_MG-2023]|nr:hypothetical protein [Granulosicoccaceae sp. 1_MG-2023]
MDEKLEKIIRYLNETKTRCTYGAVAEILGVRPQAVGGYLGRQRPEVSWIVNSKTHEPTGYEDKDKHPELYRTDRVIKSADVLRRCAGV